MNKPSLFRLLRFLLLVVVLLGILELGAASYFRLTNGAFHTNRELLAREPGSFVRDTANKDCSYRDFLFPHPYLGWVHHANPPCGWDKVSTQGFYGPAVPDKREPGVFRILLTGGSVAVQFGFVNGDYSLESMLNQAYGSEELRFEVINLAMEAWKQPQQLFAQILYGPGVDGVVSLEGFNEYFAMVEHSRNGQRMDHPWEASYLATNPFFEQTGASQVASWANQNLYVFSRDHWLGSRSRFLLLATKVIRDRFTAWAENSRIDWSESATSLDTMFSIQASEVPEAEQWNLSLYKRYLQLMQATATQTDSRLAVFIQPVPARFRTLTEQEVPRVGDLSYGDGYGEMEAALLATEKTSVYSLARIYEHFEAPVYTDPVHQEVDGAGYHLMVEKVVEVLGREWGL